MPWRRFFSVTSSSYPRHDSNSPNLASDPSSFGTRRRRAGTGLIPALGDRSLSQENRALALSARCAHTYYREAVLPAVARSDEWAWTLRLKVAPDQLIGAISLFRSETDNRGFWLGLPWHRQGLMTEACDAVTDYWFEVLKFPVLRVPKAVANAGSRRISEKQGMRVIVGEERDYVSGRLPSEIWEITAEEWRRRKRRSL
jgi:[ribosomal protein S5]-alanine N-acetyltransferase